jgi:hypothetical protein
MSRPEEITPGTTIKGILPEALISGRLQYFEKAIPRNAAQTRLFWIWYPQLVYRQFGDLVWRKGNPRRSRGRDTGKKNNGKGKQRAGDWPISYHFAVAMGSLKEAESSG